MLAETASQLVFAAALLDPDLPVPDGVSGRSGSADRRRFAVYRNNVAVSLSNALGDIFPVVKELVGEQWFAAMARVFMKQHPPLSPVLAEWGHALPAFLERFPPAQRLPYLADVARVERAWLTAFHAADADPLDAAVLAAIPQDRLADIVFKAHPAAVGIALDHAAVTIVSKSRSGETLASVDPKVPEAALITRPGNAVMVRIVPASGAVFFNALFAGRPLGEAASEAMGTDPAFDIAAALSAGLQAGAWAGCGLPNAESGARRQEEGMA